MTTTLERVVQSSVLLDFDGARILTDPWFSEKPFAYQGERRSIATAADLPELTAIVISHHHDDHCDLEALGLYPDRGVPFVVNPGTGKRVRAAGFTNVTELRPWESTTIAGVVITATPASHGVAEATYVLEGDGMSAFFGGDTRRIPELDQIAEQFPRLDLALLPINGLRIRPMFGRQEVMDATQAAELTAVLRPRVAVPIHYAFTSGPVGDRVLLKIQRDRPDLYRDAVRRLAPGTAVQILAPGELLTL